MVDRRRPLRYPRTNPPEPVSMLLLRGKRDFAEVIKIQLRGRLAQLMEDATLALGVVSLIRISGVEIT